MNAYIALDVGGTGIKASLVSETGNLLIPITHYDAKSSCSKDIILDNLSEIIIKQLHIYARPISILGVGIAFPGPFDYEKGICLIEGIGKYDSIYGINIAQLLHERLSNDDYFMNYASPSFSIRFENDASLYALGEMIIQPTISEKCICFCIGTGLGSAFIEDGKLITNREDVPSNGWVYDTPYKASIIDDYISARGILKLYETLSGQQLKEVKPIADLALAGHPMARQTFNQFGSNFSEAITTFLETFHPTSIVIGGQIAKSFGLFKESFYDGLPSGFKTLDVRLSEDSSLSTLLGVIGLFER